MRYLILSDIHGNLEAFQRIFAELSNLHVDKIVFLGDIIGYGADPHACLKQAQELSDAFVCGNHEYAVYDPGYANRFNPYAYEAIEWTRAQLKKSDVDFIKKFSFVKTYETFTLVHGSTKDPEEFLYIFNAFDADQAFRHCSTDICFIGHTHVPVIFVEGVERGAYLEEGTYTLEKNKRYIINVGSIGQPRDSDKRSACAIFDDSQYCVELVRLAYENKKAATKIRKAGLPAYLADRLL